MQIQTLVATSVIDLITRHNSALRHRLAPADKRAYQLYAECESRRPATEQEIHATFRSDQ